MFSSFVSGTCKGTWIDHESTWIYFPNYTVQLCPSLSILNGDSFKRKTVSLSYSYYICLAKVFVDSLVSPKNSSSFIEFQWFATNFHPEDWGNDPTWRSVCCFFADGWAQTSTCSEVPCVWGVYFWAWKIFVFFGGKVSQNATGVQAPEQVRVVVEPYDGMPVSVGTVWGIKTTLPWSLSRSTAMWAQKTLGISMTAWAKPSWQLGLGQTLSTTTPKLWKSYLGTGVFTLGISWSQRDAHWDDGLYSEITHDHSRFRPNRPTVVLLYHNFPIWIENCDFNIWKEAISFSR